MRIGTMIKIVIAVVVVLIAAVVVALFTVDFSRFKGEIASRVTAATGRTLTIAGDFKLNLLPLPTLAVKDVSLANAPGGSRPEMAKIGELDAKVEVLPLLFGGNIKVKQLVLKDVDLLLETDAKGHGNWQFGTPGQPAPATPAAPAAAPGTMKLPEIEKLDFENVTVTYRDGVSKQTTSVVLHSLSADTAGGSGPLAIKLAADYQKLPITLDAKLGTIDDLLNGGKAFPVNADITVGGVHATLQGKVAQPLKGAGIDLAVTVAAQDLQSLAPLTGGALPAGKPLMLKANLTGDAGKALHLANLQASLGATQVAGDATLGLGGARPKLTAKLTSPMIDVTEFTGGAPAAKPAAAGGGGAAAGKGGSGRLFSPAPLDFGALGAADADVTLNAAHIKTASATLDDAAMHLVLDDRNLQIKPLSGVIEGNRFAGDVALAARQRTPAVTVNLDAKNLNIGVLLKQASGRDLLDAKGDLAVAVKGTGTSVAGIMGSLNGTTNLVVGKGTLKTNYTDLLASDVISQALPWAKNASGNTLNCIVSAFDIKNGIATSRTLLFDSSQVTMAGGGTVDLGKEQLDLLIKPQPKQASLVSLAVPIRVRGSLTNPSVLPDTTALAKGAAGAVIGGAINPLGALLPLVSGGSSDQNPCLTALHGGSGATPPPAGGTAAPAKPASPAEGVKGLLKSLPFGK